MPRHGSILVIDDEDIMREILEALLTREGYTVRLASGGAEGLELAKSLPFDAAIVDVMMPGMDGMAVLEELKKIDDDLPVLMITAFASVENAIAAMKRGAFDYITKPFKNDEVLVVVRNAMERRQLIAENTALRQNLQAQAHNFAGIIGRSPKMKQVSDVITQAPTSRSTILITGESGTGKELVARSTRTHSSGRDRACGTVNSGNLPPELLESTLFGHVKGAFTGAVYPKKGLCDMADKGTIFFDEIGNIPLETQAKLLRVIQEREFMRLGGMETIKVDVRITAATNCDLKQMMEAGRFREDLYYRLHVITIFLPPLRQRKEDIPVLAQHFLAKYGEENNKAGLELAPEALDLLMEYHWPGNVRELENVMERAVVLATGPRIGVDLIPDHVRTAPAFQIPKFAARHQHPQRIDEFPAAAVIQPAARPTAMFDGRVVARAGEHRRADREALEHRQRDRVVRAGRNHHVGGFVGHHSLAVWQHAGLPQVGRVRDLHHLHAHQHERRVAVLGRIAVEVLEHLLAAVVGLHASAVEHERSVQAMPAAEGDAAIGAVVVRVDGLVGLRGALVVRGRFVGGVLLVAWIRMAVRRVDADPAKLVSRGVQAEVRAEQRALVARDESDRAGRGEQIRPQAEAQDRTETQARKEDAAFGRDRQPVNRRPVNEREEDDRVVRAVLPLEVFDQARHGWSEPANPFHLLGARPRRVEDAIGELAERVGVARLVHREAAHEHAADAVRAFPVLVLPRPRIAGGGRQHFDVVAHAELLVEQAARVLGARRHFAALPLRDEGELHAGSPMA